MTTWHGGTTPVSLYILYGQRKFRSHTSDLWTDAATVVRAVREENESEEKESVERRARCQGPQKSRKIARDCVVPCFFSNVLWLQRSMRRFAKAAGAEAAGPSGHMWIFIGHKFLSREILACFLSIF